MKDRELLILSLVGAIVLLTTPLQHNFELSRFQHYAIGVFTVATGFFLQALVSWRHTMFWGRAAMLGSAIYLGAFAYVCYSNPWLDWNFDLQTQMQGESRHQFAALFLFAGLVVSFLWSRWLNDSQRARTAELNLAIDKQIDELTELEKRISK